VRVTGIIVDSFSALRDEKYRVELAMKSECFICGIKSAEFDRNGSGWNHHKGKDHNMWNYLEFFIHLDEKNVTEFTYMEHMIAEKLVAQVYDFFPINQALVLEEDRSTDGGNDATSADAHISADVGKRLSEMEKKLEAVATRAEILELIARLTGDNGSVRPLLSAHTPAATPLKAANAESSYGFPDDAGADENTYGFGQGMQF